MATTRGTINAGLSATHTGARPMPRTSASAAVRAAGASTGVAASVIAPSVNSPSKPTSRSGWFSSAARSLALVSAHCARIGVSRRQLAIEDHELVGAALATSGEHKRGARPRAPRA